MPKDQTHYIIQYDPILDNSLVLHHLILYTCYEPMPTEPHECGATPVECFGMIWGWAPGGSNLILPDEVGVAVGKGTDVEYVLLQAHYHNPDLLSGLVDSSGVLLTFTTVPRLYNMGIFILGVPEDNIIIPPGIEDYEILSTCSPQDTVDLIEHDMHIIGTLLHAHLLGNKLWTDVFDSNGTYLGALSKEDPYDFGLQGFRKPPPAVSTLRAGYTLETHCNYNSTSRNATTFGGGGTRDEMCYSFVAYYPKLLGSNVCVSGSV